MEDDDDKRHVREMLTDLEVEQATDAATPCNMDKTNENNARSDGSKGRETYVNRDSAKPNTIGMMRVMVTTSTECR